PAPRPGDRESMAMPVRSIRHPLHAGRCDRHRRPEPGGGFRLDPVAAQAGFREPETARGRAEPWRASSWRWCSPAYLSPFTVVFRSHSEVESRTQTMVDI